MKNILKVGEVAKMLGVTVRTIQRWDTEGILKARRTITNRRYYLLEDIQKLLDEELSDI